MKARSFRVGMLVLVAILLLAVPASAGKPAPSLDVVWADVPTGSTWSPSYTITWTDFKPVDIYYDVTYYDQAGVQHMYPSPAGGIEPVDPRLRLESIVIDPPGVFDVASGTCKVTEHVRIYDRRGRLRSATREFNACLTLQ